jgi:dTDP-4-amino-4,6-dideoxygalactose transaminase
MVTTKDGRLADRARSLRNHGASISEEQRHRGPKPFLFAEYNRLGFNYRMTDLQAAVGLVQLSKLDRYISERQRWAEMYKRELQDVSWLRTPNVPAECVHGWQSYVCWVDAHKSPASRNNLMEKLLEAGVSTRPGTQAVHMLGYYRERYGFRPDDFPVARDAELHSLAIPLHNRMDESDYAAVVDALRNVSA